MKKQAYLIMAHNQIDLLKILIQSLDFEGNDIYLMLDKKVSINQDDIKFDLKKSHLYFVKRIDVKWGDYSQIEAEMELLKKAVTTNSYSYFHLISGTDLPIKPITNIFNFFDTANSQYVEICGIKEEDLKYRCNYYHLLSDNKVLRLINKVSIVVQKILHINRRKKNIQYAKGASWFSITSDFANYLVSKEKEVYNMFNHTFCCDEVFLQTVLVNSPYSTSICDQNRLYPIYRYIIWDKDHIKSPKWIEKNDLEKINIDECLFARKFDYEKNKDAVEYVLNVMLRGENDGIN